ncbi:hypothetical protein F2P81_022054 [Scophthalmus maximus]|uniref:C3H1-type domain-containing protein n=1 Tax=Scophthalmus maximus TaxID=52904 RepID=A0A6A4RT40_SCOMX|nr:hypothetical protein F2P81_022054 [Scophthalmus maximus]
MDPERLKRREEIQKAMSFIQSSLPFPEPESYESFLIQLVCNLLDEGNSCFRDGDWRQAAQQYGEGISVARYAQAEALVIPHELLECLYVNRAAAYYQTREYERGYQDCDSALYVSESSRMALYRKALCLRELGRFREAYECGTKCLLTAPHDRQVSDLAQDLANRLGLKGRKAYISPQIESTAGEGENLGENSPPTGETSSNGLESLGDIGPGDMSSAQCIPAPLATPIPVSDEPGSPGVTPCTDLSESPSSQNLPPMPYSVPVSEHMDECNSVIKEELNNLLECIPRKSPVQGAIPTNLPNTAVALRPPYSPNLPAPSPQLPPAFFIPPISDMPPLEPYSPLAQRDQGSTQAQDALGGGRVCHSFIPGMRNNSAANGPTGTNLSLLSRNPLAATHEFRQACHACYSRIGPRVMDYKYQPEAAHRCKRDVLLCRLKSADDPTWKRIRPRPARNNFLGAFVLCKEVQERQECQYGENCTFAYCQEEIDVWTQERKGALSRELLFDPLGSTERRALSVTRLLQLHMGMFMFLCEECFDSKPRIISKRSKENLAVCSNLTARHPFDDNKCLVHVVRSANVRYSKVRPLHPLCQFDVCRHEVRYGCQREDSCSFAHSVIELKCWVLQQDTGITHEEMVQESKRHWQRLEQNAQKQQKPIHIPHLSSVPAGGVGGMGGDGLGGGGVSPMGGLGAAAGRGRPLNLKMKFVCGQCWREGQVNEPDKNLKYCTAKARHSLEERDVWTYMKNNSLRDMQQMYELWLQLTNQSRRTESSAVTPPLEDKQVTITADYTDGMMQYFSDLSIRVALANCINTANGFNSQNTDITQYKEPREHCILSNCNLKQQQQHDYRDPGDFQGSSGASVHPPGLRGDRRTYISRSTNELSGGCDVTTAIGSSSRIPPIQAAA